MNSPTTTLGISNQRAMSDLLAAERQLREQSERSIQEFRQLLLETALRLDGERLEALRRDNPTVPGSWTVKDWHNFLEYIPSARGWGSEVPSNTQPARERELLQQIDVIQAQLDEAVHQLEEERERAQVDAMSSSATKHDDTAITTPTPLSDVSAAVYSDPIGSAVKMELPEGVTPMLADIIADAKSILSSLPKLPPAQFDKALDGGNRIGGDLARIYQRYWIAVYVIGRWRLCAAMEIEAVVAHVAQVSSGSGSLRRVLDDLVTANILVGEKIELDMPRTALKIHRLSEYGERLYQVLFNENPMENDWAKLIRMNGGDNSPEHTLAVLTFTMLARKRGWMTRVLPEISSDQDDVSNVWIGRGTEAFYVEVQSGKPANWRDHVKLNNNSVAICALTERSRQRLAGDCKLDNLAGVATDLETLVKTKYKTIDHTTPLWIELWN